jgi:hypothetical protein
MFDQQNFGHFGAPDMLPQSYGTAEPQESPQELATDYTNLPESYVGTYYRPAGQALPYLRGGATDAVVESETGIKGLVSEILNTMETWGVDTSRGLADSVIKSYQSKYNELTQGKKIAVDGIIGPETYAVLEADSGNKGYFKPPYQSGSVGTGTGLAKPKGTQANPIGAKWYQTNTFKYSMIGLAVVGTIAILAWPRAGASEE